MDAQYYKWNRLKNSGVNIHFVMHYCYIYRIVLYSIFIFRRNDLDKCENTLVSCKIIKEYLFNFNQYVYYSVKFFNDIYSLIFVVILLRLLLLLLLTINKQIYRYFYYDVLVKLRNNLA